MNDYKEKIELLIEYLKEKQPFRNKEICELFKVSLALSTVLRNAGYLEKNKDGAFVATDLIDSLTFDIYTTLMSEYQKKIDEKYIVQKTQKPVTIQDFLKNRMGKNDAKELATAIYNVIKPYL